ncbi:ABC transporter permease [Myxococcus sp. RHSTA-1-4]|uniref:ABC transporter permease n=1 Tax=Myxococcus sp. RHSTA-1-4 TaxID=2874601 RepID=UPI001CC03DC7|nr:ABC transporter permease [Myxococcus sp. RHSTA-1-4]MBZ4421749.1 ABC transporter permease [Myxococcus sp. RHSTA-1-4]
MNLAMKDVRHQWPRFVATGVGLGLLFAIVLAMGGIYRGMVEEAVVLVEKLGADLWVVQRDTRGPFAERSYVPEVLATRARAVPGVRWARAFSTLTLQPVHRGRVLRLTLVGLSWPEDRGASLPLVSGRVLGTAHRELMVDRTLGLALGEALHLGDDTYRIVGLTQGLVSSGGDALAFVSQSDLERIQNHLAPEARRLARVAGAPPMDPGVSAVLVGVAPGASVEEVRARLARWGDVTVHTTGEQKSFLLDGVVDKARRQIGLFRALLALVSGIVVSLVIFNMTVAKTREIALLKLMGARLGLVVGMILQQALLLSLLAYGVALGVSRFAFPHFPRKVVVGPEELLGVFALSVAIALLASLAAIRRALRIPPTTILAG